MHEYRRNPNTKCVVCSKAVYKRPSQIKINNGNVFCSQYCYGISIRKEKPCGYCGAMILSGANKKTCNRSCANKHRRGVRYKVGRPRDKVKDQRSLKIRLLKARGKRCERCGHNKYEILQMHHKDRNKLNNEMKNLELVCPNCHAEEHFLKNSWLNNHKIR